MKIRVHFSNSTMSIYFISGFGTTKLGSQGLDEVSISPKKAWMYRAIYSEQEEYDLEKFFISLIKLRNLKFFNFLDDNWAKEMAEKIRRDLINEEA